LCNTEWNGAPEKELKEVDVIFLRSYLNIFLQMTVENFKETAG